MVQQVPDAQRHGRGLAYSQAIFADWGNKDTDDVLAVVDYAVAQGLADPDRLGVGGWSYGGIMTDQVIARDQRFKAAVSGASIANVLAGYGTDQYIRDYETELGTPWKNPDVYMRVSYPFYHADRIKTPTLFVCGEKDFNVPLLNTEQMYQALQSLHVPTQLVIYPGQFHGVTTPSYVKDRYGRYLPGPGIHALAAQALYGSGLVQRALGPLAGLSDLGLSVALGVLWRGSVSYLYHASPGMDPIEGVGRIGVHAAMRSGLGQVLLADQAARGAPDEALYGVPRDALLRWHELGYALTSGVLPGERTVAVALGARPNAAVGLAGVFADAKVPTLVRRLRVVGEQIEPSAT